MMSALNITRRPSLQAEVISDESQIIIIFCGIGLSIVNIFANLAVFLVIQQKFKTTLVYRIQQIDSLVTTFGQIGFIIILFERISDIPNASMCTLATALCEIAGDHFLLSNVLMITGK